MLFSHEEKRQVRHELVKMHKLHQQQQQQQQKAVYNIVGHMA